MKTVLLAALVALTAAAGAHAQGSTMPPAAASAPALPLVDQAAMLKGKATVTELKPLR